MQRPVRHHALFIAEIVAVFGLGLYALDRGLIGGGTFYLCMGLAALVFALFYGVKGALAPVLAGAAGLYLIQGEGFAAFVSRHYLEASFLIGALVISGMVRSAMEARVVGAELSAQVLEQRLERLTVELSEKDSALQDILREVLTDTESPAILYQALRRIEGLREKSDIFEEVLQVLYRHCHVEKSCLYEVRPRRRFRRVAVFGPSQLPERLAWDSLDMPEILRVVSRRREVVVPVRIDHRLTMAVPIAGRDERLRYVLLVEEIRFINFNDAVIHRLKLTAFWVKYLIEGRLGTEALQAYSRYASVIVYRPEFAGRVLGRRIASHRKYRLPYALLCIDGAASESEVQRVARRLRIYDELFLLDEDRLVVLLSMIRPRFVGLVRRRLAAQIGEERVRSIGKPREAHER